MSMSVGFRTIGSEANSETARPSATVNFFTDSRAASGPTPAGLAANNVETASTRGARSNDILFIEREAAESTRGVGGEPIPKLHWLVRFGNFRRQLVKGPTAVSPPLGLRSGFGVGPGDQHNALFAECGGRAS